MYGLRGLMGTGGTAKFPFRNEGCVIPAAEVLVKESSLQPAPITDCLSWRELPHPRSGPRSHPLPGQPANHWLTESMQAQPSFWDFKDKFGKSSHLHNSHEGLLRFLFGLNYSFFSFSLQSAFFSSPHKYWSQELFLITSLHANGQRLWGWREDVSDPYFIALPVTII